MNELENLVKECCEKYATTLDIVIKECVDAYCKKVSDIMGNDKMTEKEKAYSIEKYSKWSIEFLEKNKDEVMEKIIF